MWFVFSIIALLFWSGSDLFSKIGCVDSNDKYSHLKMGMAVGLVMGLHALYEINFGGVEFSLDIAVRYLPISLLYISSMLVGYLGLRYIELSISSPICNSSGAIVAILTIIFFGFSEDIPKVALVGVACVCVGVIALGITESTENEELRALRQSEGNRKYAKSALAIAIPIIYCILDALGTFGDSIVLQSMDEDSANCAYELTWLLVGIVCAIYVLVIKKQKLTFKAELPKYTGAICETIGQYFYIHALANEEYVVFAAPIISSYCVASMLWSRIFLKEKLSARHYISIAVVVAGIIILGVLDI